MPSKKKEDFITDQTEKLLMRAENVLSIAADLVDEVSRLKGVKEECQILKEKIFLKQLSPAEQAAFALALDSLPQQEMQKNIV